MSKRGQRRKAKKDRKPTTQKKQSPKVSKNVTTKKRRFPVGTTIGLAALILAAFGAYWQFYPVVTMVPEKKSENVIQANFVVKNEGYFTMKKVKGTLYIRNLEAFRGFSFKDTKMYNFSDVDLGDIRPRDSAVAKTSIMTPPGYYKKGSICFKISFDYTFPYGRQEWLFGFLMDKTRETEDWIKKPKECEGVNFK